MSYQPNIPPSAVAKMAKLDNGDANADEGGGGGSKRREDYKKSRELEEMRKAGTAPAMQDEQGLDINPHIPQYIMQAPWYFGADCATLRHQRQQEEKMKVPTQMDIWYKRGLSVLKAGPAVTKYRKGACENCGALSHKKVDCLERPRKVGAKFSGMGFAADEIIQDNFAMDYESKRDRWNGLDIDEYRERIKEDFEKIEQAKKILKMNRNEDMAVVEDPSGEAKEIKHESDDEDEEKYADDMEMPGQKFETKQRITVRNLRIREDTAKYLFNLDVDSAHYDPKTRSMRQNPYGLGTNMEEVTYGGDNFVRMSGDAYEYAKKQLFSWEAYEKGTDVHVQSDPTKLELLSREYKSRKDNYEFSKKQTVLDKYGGAEHLESLPKELLLSQSEHYVEYSREGVVVKGQEKAKMKSMYEEDVYPNNHRSVWGSFWKEGKWGFDCCHSMIKESYCTGIVGKSIDTVSDQHVFLQPSATSKSSINANFELDKTITMTNKECTNLKNSPDKQQVLAITYDEKKNEEKSGRFKFFANAPDKEENDAHSDAEHTDSNISKNQNTKNLHSYDKSPDIDETINTSNEAKNLEFTNHNQGNQLSKFDGINDVSSHSHSNKHKKKKKKKKKKVSSSSSDSDSEELIPEHLNEKPHSESNSNKLKKGKTEEKQGTSDSSSDSEDEDIKLLKKLKNELKNARKDKSDSSSDSEDEVIKSSHKHKDRMKKNEDITQLQNNGNDLKNMRKDNRNSFSDSENEENKSSHKNKNKMKKDRSDVHWKNEQEKIETLCEPPKNENKNMKKNSEDEHIDQLYKHKNENETKRKSKGNSNASSDTDDGEIKQSKTHRHESKNKRKNNRDSVSDSEDEKLKSSYQHKDKIDKMKKDGSHSFLKNKREEIKHFHESKYENKRMKKDNDDEYTKQSYRNDSKKKKKDRNNSSSDGEDDEIQQSHKHRHEVKNTKKNNRYSASDSEDEKLKSSYKYKDRMHKMKKDGDDSFLKNRHEEKEDFCEPKNENKRMKKDCEDDYTKHSHKIDSKKNWKKNSDISSAHKNDEVERSHNFRNEMKNKRKDYSDSSSNSENEDFKSSHNHEDKTMKDCGYSFSKNKHENFHEQKNENERMKKYLRDASSVNEKHDTNIGSHKLKNKKRKKKKHSSDSYSDNENEKIASSHNQKIEKRNNLKDNNVSSSDIEEEQIIDSHRHKNKTKKSEKSSRDSSLDNESDKIITSHIHKSKKKKKKKDSRNSSSDEEEEIKSSYKHKNKKKKKKKNNQDSLSESEDETVKSERLIKKAMRKEKKRIKQVDALMQINERKRPYNSMYDCKAPTEEELEAFRRTQARKNDPMAQFLSR